MTRLAGAGRDSAARGALRPSSDLGCERRLPTALLLWLHLDGLEHLVDGIPLQLGKVGMQPGESRQWPEVSDFVARFCTLHESENTRTFENCTSQKTHGHARIARETRTC